MCEGGSEAACVRGGDLPVVAGVENKRMDLCCSSELMIRQELVIDVGSEGEMRKVKVTFKIGPEKVSVERII